MAEVFVANYVTYILRDNRCLVLPSAKILYCVEIIEYIGKKYGRSCKMKLANHSHKLFSSENEIIQNLLLQL